MKKYVASVAAVLSLVATAAQAVETTGASEGRSVAKHHKVARVHKKYRAARMVPVVPAPAPAPLYDPSLAAPLVPLANAFYSLPFIAKDGSLTYKGITVYGGVDIGVGYQSHGTPLSNVYGAGREYLTSKNSNHTQLGFNPNALSNSNIGIKGTEQILPGLAVVFNAQTQFLPTSGRIQNGTGGLAQQNGVPLDRQVTGSDSSKDGQPFSGLVYGGLSSPTFGTLTYGRQTNLVADAVSAYDPMSASAAFSPIGYQGLTSGAGNTEDGRYDNSIKYRVNAGPFRAAAIYETQQFGNSNRDGYQFQLGGEYRNFSLDGLYSHKNSSVSASSYAGPVTAAQELLLRADPTGLSGTVSDNTSFMAVASYKWNAFKFSAGYENIRFANPQNPLAAFSPAEGTLITTANNTAYGPTAAAPNQHNRVEQVFWGGVKWQATAKLDLIGAYYHYQQNNYGGTTACTNTSPSAASFGTSGCSGTMDAASSVADYRFNKHWDVYAGAMYSVFHKGLASGFLHNSSVDPTVGMRFQF